MDEKRRKPKVVKLNVREIRKLNRGDIVNLEVTHNSGRPLHVRLDDESLRTVRAVARLFTKDSENNRTVANVRCNICARSFATKEGMRVHRFRTHRTPGITR